MAKYPLTINNPVCSGSSLSILIMFPVSITYLLLLFYHLPIIIFYHLPNIIILLSTYYCFFYYLFDTVIKKYNISEFRHTEKRTYLEKSRNQALLDAKSKADLILNNSSQKTGKIISIKENTHNSQKSSNRSFYGTDNAKKSENSSFKPIIVSYSIIVVFEILDR